MDTRVQTMVLTDVATGWTECIPIVVREAEIVVHALGRARELFPFHLRGRPNTCPHDGELAIQNSSRYSG